MENNICWQGFSVKFVQPSQYTKSRSFEEKEINLFAKKKINLYYRIMIKLRSLQFNKYSYNFKSMLPQGQERDYTLCFED